MLVFQNVDDFKRYCSLLTERIKKVEQQNKELIKLAEKQKIEYDKVMITVMISNDNYRISNMITIVYCVSNY